MWCNLTAVTIPDSVTSIGAEAFTGSKNLKTVNIGNGVTVIGNEAFSSCYRLETLTIGNSVETIGEEAFSGCSFTEITLPDSLKTVGDSAFSSCSKLTTVNLGSGIEQITLAAFYNCDLLTTFNVSEDNPNFKSVDGVLLDKAGETIVLFPLAKGGEYIIPDGVTKIIDANFANCDKLTAVTIPDSVKSIGARAFSGCEALTTVTMGNGVTEIGASAFYECRELATINISDGVTSIGEKAFYNTAITEIVIPDSVTTLGKEAFRYSSLKTAKLGNGITEIPEGLFRECYNLETFNIPDGVTIIGDRSFFQCKPTTITIPDSVKIIDVYAFWACEPLTTVTLGKNVEIIGGSAFSYCPALVEINIPDGVTCIDGGAFSGCEALANINIPDSVITVGYNAFYNTAIVNNQTDDTLKYIDNWLVQADDDLTTATIKEGTVGMCRRAFRESQYTLESVTIPDSMRRIPDEAFYECQYLTSVDTGNGVESIGELAFYSCYALTSVTVGTNVKHIGKEAFYYCRNLETVDLPDGLLSIGPSAFAVTAIVNNQSTTFKYVDKWLVKATNSSGEKIIEDGTVGIADCALLNCSSIGSVIIPESLKIIGKRAFEGCFSMKTVYIPATVETIGDYAFGYRDTNWSLAKYEDFVIRCEVDTAAERYAIDNEITYRVGSGDESSPEDFAYIVKDDGTLEITGYTGEAMNVIIPDEIEGKLVTSIGDNAFAQAETSDTSFITTLKVPDTVCRIGERAFYWNTALQKIELGNGVIEIGKEAFAKCFDLVEVDLGNSVEIIGESAFNNDYNILEITIPDSVKAIDEYAFDYCNKLETVNMGKGVEFIGGFAFGSCSKLVNISIPDSVKTIEYGAFMHTAIVKNQTAELKYIDNWLVEVDKNIVNAVVKDGTVGFAGRLLGSMEKLESVTLPDSITDIPEYFFYCNYNLKTVNLGNGVTTIGEYAFYECTDLTEINLGNSIQVISRSAFDTCIRLETIEIPDSVIKIEKNAFYSTAILDNQESDLKYAGKWLIGGDYLVDIVEIRPGTVGIADSALSDTSFESVIIPDSVKIIGESAFSSGKDFKSVVIPASVEVIGDYAFGYNTSYTELVKNEDFVIYCYSGTAGEKYAIDNWFDYYFVSENGFVTNENSEDGTIEIIAYAGNATEVEIPSEIDGKKVTVISSGAFKNCKTINSVTIPDTVTIIGQNAFEGSSITAISIPDSVTFIGNLAFSECDSFVTVTIPGSVKTIHKMAFESCDALKTVTIKEGVTDIRENAFSNCGKLETVTLPEGLTRIGDDAFNFCFALSSINIPDSVTSIGDSAFYDTLVLEGEEIKYVGNWVVEADELATVIDIKPGTVGIADEAFASAYEISSLTIPDTVKYIGRYAFSDWQGTLTSATIPKSVVSIGEKAFGYNGSGEKTTGFIIYCYKDTAGESYAKDNGFEYKYCECEQHDYGEWITVTPATCTEDGLKKHVCKVCGTEETDIIPATGHTWGTWEEITPATCTESGEKQHKCEVCDAIEKEPIPATGHSFSTEWTVDVEPTCTETGSKSHHCENCGAIEKGVIPATGHSFSTEWTVDVEPTCTETGSKSHHCENCDAKADVTEIPATGHKFVDEVVEPTYTAKGYTLHTCSVCGYSYKDDYTNELVLSEISGFKASSKTDTTITLKWNKNSEATGYIIEQYKDDKWVRIAKLTSNATTSYKVTKLTASTRYPFRIQAYKEIGKGAVKSEYTDKLIVYTDPKDVTGFKAKSRSDTTITLSWTKNTTATGYILEQYKGNKWVRIAKITSNATTSYKVSKLTASTRYAFRIQAYKEFGSGAVKSEYTDKLVVYTNPKDVTGFKYGGKTSSVIRLNWNKNTTATGYILEQYKGNKWVRIAKITNNSTTTYRVTGLKANTRYAFRIQAYREFGSGAVKSDYTNKLVVYTNK